jgi:hypothetical protein
MSRIIFGTLIPVLAIGVIAAVIITREHSHAPVVHSVAAYESCIRTAGLAARGATASVSLTHFRACQRLLPPGTVVENAQPQGSGESQAAFEQCIRSAIAKLGGQGFGQRGPSPALETAEAVCRSLGQPPTGRPSGSSTP